MGVNDFIDLMPHTVTVAPVSSIDGFGNPTFGTAVSYTARVVGKVQMVRTVRGEEKSSTKTVYLATTTVIAPDALVTLPAGEVPLSPPILAVGTFPDEAGAHHTVLFL